MGERLGTGFFARDAREVARDLIGCELHSRSGGVLTGGRIVEAEAYLGRHDPGSHAATVRPTARNAIMYGPPGTLYVYLSYGNHEMLNLICEQEGTAAAVLVRALEPTVGIDTMRERAPRRSDRDLARGPGRLAEVLGISRAHNGCPLGTDGIEVYAGGRCVPTVAESGRVGLSAGEDLPYRFFDPASPYVSGPVSPRRATRRGESV